MRTHRLAWLRLNSDLLLIVLLCFSRVFFDIRDPFRDEIVAAAGFVTPLFLLVLAGYGLGGLILLYSLIRGRIHAEVIGRAVIVAALFVEIYRSMAQLGIETSDTQSAIAVAIAFIATSILRVSALFNKNGITFQLPPRIGTVDEAVERGEFDA